MRMNIFGESTLSLASIMPRMTRNSIDDDENDKYPTQSFPLARMDMRRVSTSNSSRTSPTDNSE